ncbi:TPA: IS1 family transposase, partial [Klebsiella pneumoniae]
MASVSISCPSRSATDGVVRNGKSTAGHQRYLCSHCRKTWQLQFTYTASQPGTHQKIIDMAMNDRYRLNRGGDRAANSALHIIAIGRLRTDAKTKEYVARRVAEGHTKMDAIRCLKRYISREVYTLLRNQ